jgi:hypothetical protein
MLSAVALSKFDAKVVGATILSIMTLNITTMSIKDLFVTLVVSNTYHKRHSKNMLSKNALCNKFHYDECHSAE